MAINFFLVSFEKDSKTTKNYWMRLSRILRIIQTEVSVNAHRGLNNSEYPAKAEFNFIIHPSRKIGDASTNKNK